MQADMGTATDNRAEDTAAEGRTRPRTTFYVLRETPCPYLAGRRERKLLTDLNLPAAQALYSELSRAGFRRSHGIAYRPACNKCTACVPVRVQVPAFTPSRSLRRVLQANRSLVERVRPAVASEEQYLLFRSYLRSRHWDGEMAGMVQEDYRAMVEDTRLDTRINEYREPDGRLVAACIVDWLEDGPSAVYSFFEPELAQRSLGSFMILALIRQAREAELPYLYLGYWIENSPKMDYKARFRPIEGLGPKGWRVLER